MICFVTTRAHRYTHKRVGRWSGAPKVEVWSYDQVFAARALPWATWIFCDFDRLGFWDLELAARLWRILRDAGMRVLNDPARARLRFALLRKLAETGIGCFGVWRAEDTDRPRPEQFPVFLRNEAAHRGVLSDLIADPTALDLEIERAVETGYPRRDLMIVQYAAEPVSGGLFRKLSVYKIGPGTVPALCVHQDDWCVKAGTRGIASPELYQQEHEIIATNPYGEILSAAFAAGDVDYGRADFAFVRGRLAVYEINTNPAIAGPADHPSRVRTAAYELWRSKYITALAAIDTPDNGQRIAIGGEIFSAQRRRDFPYVRSRWTA